MNSQSSNNTEGLEFENHSSPKEQDEGFNPASMGGDDSSKDITSLIIDGKKVTFDTSNPQEVNNVLDLVNDSEKVEYPEESFGENKDSSSKEEAYPQIELAHKKNREITICGEVFNYEFDNDDIIIKHPKWSIIGVGSTLYDAEKDLFENMKIIADEYINESDSSLDINAIYLKQFLIETLY